MSDKKLECDNCDTTYLDEKGAKRCARYKHKTEGYYAEGQKAANLNKEMMG